MNAQDTRKRSIDWLMRLAQVASITVALIISTESMARHWRADSLGLRLWLGAWNGHDTRALQAYLGRWSIQHTVRYAELSPQRFKDFWR